MRILLLLLLAAAVLEVAAQVGGENTNSALEAYLRCEDLDCAEALKALIRHRAAQDPLVRAAATEALPRVDGRRVLEALVSLLADPDELVRVNLRPEAASLRAVPA